MSNFWNELNRPFFALAPMEDVTDTVFRELINTLSEPNTLKLYFTEFTSIDGLCHPKGYNNVAHRLFVNPSEQARLALTGGKLVAQIWGNSPDKFIKAAQIITQMGHFNGIDINMGCPDKSVVKHGSGSALIDNPNLVTDIIAATKSATNLPVSIKTRIGTKTIVTESWLTHLLSQPIDALTIHGRTQKQMSDGQADWNEIGKEVRIKQTLNRNIPILGNGDILTVEQGLEMIEQHQLDGVMVGRGIFHNPWMFDTKKTEVSLSERLETLLNHVQQYERTFANQKNFAQLKRFFKIYISKFDGASQLRDQLMRCNNAAEVIIAISDFANSIQPIKL